MPGVWHLRSKSR